MFNDTVSDFVTQIRNASASGKEEIVVRYAKVVKDMADVMKQAGFITSYSVEGYKIIVKLAEARSVTHIKRLSKPGLRRYVKSTEVPKPHSGLGMVILSTPKGVLSGNQAVKQKVGGELLCEVW